MTGPLLYLALLAAGTVTAVVFGQCGHRLDLARARHQLEFMRLTVALPPERYELTEETPMYPIGRRHPGMVVPAPALEWPLPPVQGCTPPPGYVACLDRPEPTYEPRHAARPAWAGRTEELFHALVTTSLPDLRTASYVESAT